jgi:hypothetical protein
MGQAMLGVLTPFGEASLVQVHLVPPLPTGEITMARRLYAMLGVLTPLGEASLVLVHLVPPLPASEVRTVRADLFILLPPCVVGIDFLAFPPRFLIVRAASRIHHATS